ncbi:MAG: carbohydrate kinase family protein, partial [Spirochaetes bacterium]|nr:carbohydrate kinase family protein [Spirochaetota bacterium]
YRPYTWQSEEIASITYQLAAQKCHVIIGTREEFEVMERFCQTPVLSDEQIAEKWLKQGTRIIIIKHGKAGSHAFSQDHEPVKHGIFPGKLKKTYGAGDAFASGFIYGMLEKYSLVQSLGIGSAAASINISRDTCTEAMPRVDELKPLLNYLV